MPSNDVHSEKDKRRDEICLTLFHLKYDQLKDTDFADDILYVIKRENIHARTSLLESLRDWNSPGGIHMTDQEIDRRIAFIKEQSNV